MNKFLKWALIILFWPISILVFLIKTDKLKGKFKGAVIGIYSLILIIAVATNGDDSSNTAIDTGSAAIIESTTSTDVSAGTIEPSASVESEVSIESAESEEALSSNTASMEMNDDGLPQSDTEESDNSQEVIAEVAEGVAIVARTKVDFAYDIIAGMGLENNTIIDIYGGDLNGYREHNVVVDIGYGDREYWGYTNEYGQLVLVVAAEIILQDDTTEEVTSEGRYYPDEAKVPGTEAADLDEGHVIADSLGGVANAYNITPQDSSVNRWGEQAYMEDTIRSYGGARDFIAEIEYDSYLTQTPSHYHIEYTFGSDRIIEDFDNKSNEEVVENSTDTIQTESLGTEDNSTQNSVTEVEEEVQEETDTVETGGMEIIKLDKRAEYVIIKNTSSDPINIGGWRMVSEKGNQSFTFPSGYTLASGQECKLCSKGALGTGDFDMANGYIWNNDELDPAVLYDSTGNEIDRMN